MLGLSPFQLKRMLQMLDVFTTYYAENPGSLMQLAICVGLFAACYIISRVVRYKVCPWLVAKSEKRIKKVLFIFVRGFAKPLPVLVWSIGLYFALLALPMPPQYSAALRPWFDKLLNINLIAMLAWGLVGASDIGPLMMQRVQGGLSIEMDPTVTNFINRLLKGVVITFAVLMVLEEVGVPVASLIASLGVVSLTLGLAAKDYATNFMGGVMILFEKPFALGDWIKTTVGEGEVEDIAFRSTRIRTLENAQLVIPNSVLVNEALTNYSRISKRLAKFTLGVTYSASRAQLETLMESIRAMLIAREDVWEDSVRVQFTGFGDSSLNILVQYYAKTGVLADFLKVQEEVNLALMGLMEQAGCEFAFPSMSIYREK